MSNQNNQKEIIVVFIALLILSVVSILLYGDYNRSAFEYKTKPVGTITYRYRIAQHRSSSSVVWKDVEQNSPIYNNSLIRTDEISEAIITLNDKTIIELDPESMIVLQVKERDSNIEMKSGSLLIKRIGRPYNDPIRIVSDEKEIIARSGRVRITKTIDNNLIVTPGSTAVIIRNSNEDRQIKKGESAIVSKKEIKVRKLYTNLLLPQDNHRYFINARDFKVDFEWKDKNKVIFELSLLREFERIYRRRSNQKKSLSLELPEGIYYWRIVSQDGLKRKVSEIRKFRIIRNEDIRLLTPLQDELFKYVSDPPLIQFSWEKNILARSYILEISRNKEFSSIKKKRHVFRTRIALSLKAGTYFWRIRTKGPFPTATSKSPVRSIIVQKKENLTKPIPELPFANFSIERIILQESGLLFSWRNDPEILSSTISISNSIDFKSTIYKHQTPDNFLNLEKDIKPGKYFWRIRGSNRNNQKSNYSDILSFTVTEKISLAKVDRKRPEDETRTENWIPKQLKKILQPEGRGEKPGVGCNAIPRPGMTPEKPYLIFPADDSTVDMSRRDSIPFEWKSVAGPGKYKFQLYHKGKLIFYTRTMKPRYTFTHLNRLDIGEFFWRVEKVVRWSGKSIRLGASGKFSIILSVQPEKPEIDISK